ncbi:MAG: TIGR02996 domain-containing protein [Myxococcota bacterium]
MNPSLDQARHELERAKAAPSLEEALGFICRAWERCPSSQISQLAMTYSRALPAEPIEGATQRLREERWHELAAAAEPRDLQKLLATPWTKRPADAMARLEKLARFEPDPRIVRALLELDTGHRFLSGAGNRFWVMAFEQMLAWGSPEAAARVPREPPPPGDPLLFAEARFAHIFEPLLRTWAGRLPKEPELDSETQRLLVLLSERTRPGEAMVDRLLEAVWRDPANDGPRLVLADALAEVGDPQGEFISLQLAHERGELTLGKSERMGRLLAASGMRWTGDLTGQVALPVVFRRGFVSEARLATRNPDRERRCWSTLEVLDAGGLALGLSTFLAAPSLGGVHTVLGLSVPTLIELARHATAGGEGKAFSLIELRSLAGPDLPTPAFRLHTLRIRGDTENAVSWYLASSLVGRIARLQLDVAVPAPFAISPSRLVVERRPSPLPRVGALVGELDARGKLEALELVASAGDWPRRWAGTWRLTFARDDRGRLGRLAVLLEWEDPEGLALVLRGLPDTLVSHLTLRTERKLSPADRETLTDLVVGALSAQRALSARDIALAHPVPRPREPVIYQGA